MVETAYAPVGDYGDYANTTPHPELTQIAERLAVHKFKWVDEEDGYESNCELGFIVFSVGLVMS